jgi:hypothetical protein
MLMNKNNLKEKENKEKENKECVTNYINLNIMQFMVHIKNLSDSYIKEYNQVNANANANANDKSFEINTSNIDNRNLIIKSNENINNIVDTLNILLRILNNTPDLFSVNMDNSFTLDQLKPMDSKNMYLNDTETNITLLTFRKCNDNTFVTQFYYPKKNAKPYFYIYIMSVDTKFKIYGKISRYESDCQKILGRCIKREWDIKQNCIDDTNKKPQELLINWDTYTLIFNDNKINEAELLKPFYNNYHPKKSTTKILINSPETNV